MRSGLLRAGSVGAFSLCICAMTCALAKAEFQWVSIRTLPYFDHAREQLQILVDTNGHRKANRLCVIGQRDGTSSQAYVYWPSENKLILWTPDVTDPATLVHSRRYLDLKRDVVTGDDVHGSTYLLSQHFVNQTLSACAEKGDYFTIIKSAQKGATHG